MPDYVQMGATIAVSATPTADAAIAGIGNNHFVCSWRDPSGAILGQIYDQTGVAEGTNFLVSGSVGRNVTVQPLAGGGFVMQWMADTPTGPAIYARVWDNSGGFASFTDPFALPSDTVKVLPTADGGFMATREQ